MPKRPIDERDAWFWSPQWQRAETEAQEDIDAGDVTEFDSVDDLLARLRRMPPAVQGNDPAPKSP